MVEQHTTTTMVKKRTTMAYRYAADKSQFFHFSMKPANTTKPIHELTISPMMKLVIQEFGKRQRIEAQAKLSPTSSPTQTVQLPTSPQQIESAPSSSSSLLYKMDIKYILNRWAKFCALRLQNQILQINNSIVVCKYMNSLSTLLEKSNLHPIIGKMKMSAIFSSVLHLKIWRSSVALVEILKLSFKKKTTKTNQLVEQRILF